MTGGLRSGVVGVPAVLVQLADLLRLTGELDAQTAPAVGTLLCALHEGGDLSFVIDATSAFGAEAADFALILSACADLEQADIRIIQR